MRPTIEFHILDYLGFGEPESVGRGDWVHHDKANNWKRGLRFADAAGLSLHLRDQLKRREDFEKLPAWVQIELEQRQKDNLDRTRVMLQEFVELNRQLQAAGIRYLNLKGLLLAPDFVARSEQRAQYDYDFLVRKEDLQRAYRLFVEIGYSPLHSTKALAADHLPTLIRKTGWQWKGNYHDPTIPRGIELHFQLWDADFEMLSIHSLDNVWEDSRCQSLDSIEVPALSRENTLLYCTLHAFRHLLRNDLRLSHLYEIAFFLQRSSNQEDFWQGFFARVTSCPNTAKAVATTFELARCLFLGVLPPPIRPFVSRHLPTTAESWVRAYGRSGAIHCYRKNKNALLLHLSLLDSNPKRWVLLRRRLLPRHLPLPSFGVQVPPEAQSLTFRMVKAVRYLGLLLHRCTFHVRSLAELCFHIPFWFIQPHWRKRGGDRSSPD